MNVLMYFTHSFFFSMIHNMYNCNNCVSIWCIGVICVDYVLFLYSESIIYKYITILIFEFRFGGNVCLPAYIYQYNIGTHDVQHDEINSHTRS